MDIKLYSTNRHYQDFYRVIEFLKENGAQGLNKNWHWARWEWLVGHMGLDVSTLTQIGIFENNGDIVGIVTHDMQPGKAYIICNPQFEYMKKEMLIFAQEHINYKGKSSVYIDDNDCEMKKYALENGYLQSAEKEYVLSLNCKQQDLSYTLIDNLAITDYFSSKDLNKYNSVIWNGFGNVGNPPFITENDVPPKPHQNPKLTVFAVAPNNEYVAHCGMWYLPDTTVAYLEPLVTIPEFRKLGLGKSVVYESVKRCNEMGAESVTVISNQDFYHHIGFSQISVFSLWTKLINSTKKEND